MQKYPDQGIFLIKKKLLLTAPNQHQQQVPNQRLDY